MVAGRLRWRGGVVCFGGLEEPLGEGGVRGLAPEGEGEGCVSCSRRRRVFGKMYSASSCSSSRQSYNKCYYSDFAVRSVNASSKLWISKQANPKLLNAVA